MTFIDGGPAQWRAADKQVDEQEAAKLATGTIQQRPFAPETLFTSSPWIPPTVRGWLQRYDMNALQAIGYPFNFLFNTNQLDMSYGVDPQAIPEETQDSSAIGTGIGGSSAVAISFALLIDRSHEVAYDRDTHGVRHDVECLERILSVNHSFPYLITGRTVKFVLGTNLTFYAYITSMNVSYLYFNESMIPMRCSINIQANLRPMALSPQEPLYPAGSAIAFEGGRVDPRS